MQPAPAVEPSAALLSLRRNFSWTFAGNVVYAASQWGVLVVIARLGTPEMVGQFALALAITAPIIMFANLHLRAVQATDAKRAYAFADYLGLRLLTTAAALALIVALALLSGYRAETALVILFVGLAKSCEALSDVIFGLLQQRERMDRIAKSLMIEGPATLVVMAAVLALTRSIVAAAAAMALVWLLQLLLYDARSAARLLRAWPRPRWHWPTLRRLAWLALPLGVTTLLISLNTNIPRYVMERAWGEADLGVFAALTYLIVAGSAVVAALGQAASPRLAAYYADANARAFRGLLLKLIGIGALLGAAGVTIALLLGEPLLALIYGPAYAAHADVLVLVMLAGGIGYIGSFLGYGITATRQFYQFLAIYAGVTLTALAASVVLIPPLGLTGAALTLLAVNTALCIAPLIVFARLRKRS